MLWRSYIKVNIALVVIFTILYKLTDLFMYHFAQTAKHLGLGQINNVDNIIDLFAYSLITQTTVGYSSKFLDYLDTNSIPFKILNYIQLLSIFVVTGYFLENK